MKDKTFYKVDYAILAAMPAELEFFTKKFSDCSFVEKKIAGFNFKIYCYENNAILVAFTGIGTTFAASLLTLIHSYFNPEYVLISGTAGGIKKELKIRDVVIIETAFEAEIQDLFPVVKNTPFEDALRHPMKNSYFPAQYSASSELLSLCEDGFEFNHNTIYQGTAVSSNAFPAPRELFEKIKQLNPFLIDMETSAFYQVAWLLNIKIIAVRGISNVLDSQGNDENVHESDVDGSSKAAALILLTILNKSICAKNKLKTDLTKKIGTEVSQLIQHYNLQPHTEGGYFSPQFKSNDIVKVFDERFNNEKRSAGSSIYYLLNKEDYSAWHILKADELWNFHKGSPLNIHVIDEGGNLVSYVLGDPLEHEGATFQICVKAGNYFCAENIDKTTFSLVSCIVIPGFEYQDFQLADKNTLMMLYPQHSEIIARLSCKSSDSIDDLNVVKL